MTHRRAASLANRLSQLGTLEAESIHVFREVAAELERPVLLFSGGKDSIVMLRLAQKAFWPARIPFPVLHADTGHNFGEVLAFRDRRVAELAILLFQLSEQAIAFVVVLGAAPSIANGIISGIDHVPPAFTRLGTVLGAHGWRLYRHVVIPAALPAYVSGLNQGWAFAWRSLMAGELLVIIEARPSLGSRLAFAQEFADSTSLIAYMVVILMVGMLADTTFSAVSRRLRTRRGLTGT
jgi:ABC-type anion transport system duplicated permease subunit